jgi:putative hydrolase of the HAD superfamily
MQVQKNDAKITCLFLDIGGVLLCDGWDHFSRQLAAENFSLDYEELNNRHKLNFATYEEGKLTLEEYLNRVVFYQKREFTKVQFQDFIFAQSEPYSKMINLCAQLKIKYGLKVVVVSNEARELNAYRIQKFKLNKFVDSFITSCFVHIRKPDADIFRLALDITQVPSDQIVYIENTPMFAEIAESLGIKSIIHTDYNSTCQKLSSFGLTIDEGGRHATL